MRRKIGAGLLAAAMVLSLSGCGSKDTGAAEAETAAQATADENGNYVVNGSFEEPDFTGWTVTNVDNVTEELDVYDRASDCYEGAQSLHFYSGSSEVNFTAEQTISGLEAGSYKLTGYVQGDTAGDAASSVYFYAVIDGETMKADTTLSGYVAWNEAVLSGLDVQNGEITIGVSVTNAAGGWGTIDAISLVKE